MDTDSLDFLVADPKVVAFHDKSEDFATLINTKIFETNRSQHPNPVAGGALLRISADIFTLHRSIFSLCHDGWSLVTAIILRTMIELQLNILIITKSLADCEYLGFKYMYGFHKKTLNYKGASENSKKDSKKAIDDELNRLDASTRNKAKAFVFEQPLGGYWYNPEYKSPKDILRKLNNDSIIETYELFSGATHGGMLGLALLKGQSDDIHPNPRADKFSQNLALSYSSRILIESFYARGIFEGVNLKKEFNRLWEEFKGLKDITATNY